MRKNNFLGIRSLCQQLRMISLNTKSYQWIEPIGNHTPVNLYNSVTKCKVPLITNKPNCIYWYACGPTVYDAAHIGHASCYVRFDIIRRILVNHFGMNVVTVMGITDVDDKIIKRALSLGEDMTALTRRYEQEFFEDMAKLNVLRPFITARVTDYMPHIIKFVENLINRNHGYVSDDGSVYFEVESLPDYGKLVEVSPNEQEVVPDSTGKRCSRDFALWKASKENEPFWQAPWGNGRPGWHIECSAIASALLGSNIDIHSGGIDLIFPHHENEEAQCCAHHGIPQWTNYWLHSGHLHLKDNEKMSKSLMNTINISELLKDYTSNEFRIFCLLSHYRNRIEYTQSSMDSARGVCKKIDEFLVDCEAYINGYKDKGDINESEVIKSLEAARHNIYEALADDFDTAKAMNIVINLIHSVNKMLIKEKKDLYVGSQPATLAACSNFVRSTMESFGVTARKSAESVIGPDVEFVLDSALNLRSTVRELSKASLTETLKEGTVNVKKNSQELLKACDNFRDDLQKAGIIVKDHKKKSSWTYSTAGKEKRTAENKK